MTSQRYNAKLHIMDHRGQPHSIFKLVGAIIRRECFWVLVPMYGSKWDTESTSETNQHLWAAVLQHAPMYPNHKKNAFKFQLSVSLRVARRGVRIHRTKSAYPCTNNDQREARYISRKRSRRRTTQHEWPLYSPVLVDWWMCEAGFWIWMIWCRCLKVWAAKKTTTVGVYEWWLRFLQCIEPGWASKHRKQQVDIQVGGHLKVAGPCTWHAQSCKVWGGRTNSKQETWAPEIKIWYTPTPSKSLNTSFSLSLSTSRTYDFKNLQTHTY